MENGNQPPNGTQHAAVSVNWGALFQSPLFWGVVLGVTGTLVVQHQWKSRRLETPKREPRRVLPVHEE